MRPDDRQGGRGGRGGGGWRLIALETSTRVGGARTLFCVSPTRYLICILVAVLHPPQNLQTRRHRHLSHTSAQRRHCSRCRTTTPAGPACSARRPSWLQVLLSMRAYAPAQCTHPLFCATVFQYSRLAHSVCTRDIYGSARYGNTSALRAHRTYTDPFVRERRCPRSIARECTNAESGCPNAPTPRRQVSGARATKSHAG